MESLREENYKLMLKLDSMKKEHSTELEYLKEESEIREREIRAENAKLTNEYKNREELKNEKINALNEEISMMREENESQVVELERLRMSVEVLKHAKTGGVVNNYADYEGLKESQKILKTQLFEKEVLVEKYTARCFELDKQVNQLKQDVANLSEEVEGKDECIRELNANVRDITAFKDEQVLMLQNEVLSFKEQIKGINSGSARGNSLFSEVEERRVKVEGELTRLRNMVIKLEEENKSLQAELQRGDTQSGFLSTQLENITKSETEIAAEFKKIKAETLQLFDGYRDRLEMLRSEYTLKLQEYRSNGISSDVEILRSERDNLLLYKMEMDREKTELKRELKYNKHLRNNAECNVKMLKSELDRLKQPIEAPSDNNEQESPPSCSNQ